MTNNKIIINLKSNDNLDSSIQSFISYDTLKEILITQEKQFTQSQKLTIDIVGFILDDTGITIYKEYNIFNYV